MLRQKQRGQPSPAACAMGVGRNLAKLGAFYFLSFNSVITFMAMIWNVVKSDLA